VSPLRRLVFGRRSNVLASVRTQSGTIMVRERAGFREMVASDGSSELVWTRVALEDSTRSGWPYIDLLHLAPALAKRRRRALFVGSGGAVSVRQFASAYPGIAIDLVECEPAVIELARAWFDLSAIPRVTVHIADGAAFIRAAAPCTWDIVVIDAYDASTFATEFADERFLAAVRAVLRPGGALACNVIGPLAGAGPVRQFVSAARTVFDTVRIVPVVELNEPFSGDALRNVVVVVTRSQ
jgi:spermidine synthase